MSAMPSPAYRYTFVRFQESTTDAQTRTALERLRKRVEKTEDIPSPMAQSALAIIGELERLLDMAAT